MSTKIPVKFNYKKKFKIFNFKGKRAIIKHPFDNKISYLVLAKENCIINYKQIEVIRQRITKPLKKLKNKDIYLNMRIWPIWAKTKKPLQVRMGKGKGNPYLWVTNVKKGQILFFIYGGVRSNLIKEACSRLLYKTSTYLKLIDIKKNLTGIKSSVVYNFNLNKMRRIKR